MKRKVAVVTGTRAEYGLLYWIMRDIQAAEVLTLHVLVTGAHLAPAYGLTIQQVREDFPVDAEIDTLLASDRVEAVGKAVSLGIFGFVDVFSRLKPDIVLLMADRSETFAAAVAAVTLGIRIAHLSGGEATEGLMDDQFRHAITKMSHLHFVSMEAYRNRVIQMGENPLYVLTVGEPGLDHCVRTPLMAEVELSEEIGLDFSREVALVTFHPVTLELDRTELYVAALLDALERFPKLQLLFTYPGADPTSQVIVSAFGRFVESRANAVLVKNLGFRRYLSVLKHARFMVGNSSSGIVEAPSFGLPVVNVGSRQGGRVRAGNVIDVECTAGAIASGLVEALEPNFLKGLCGMTNPYGDGDASRRIVKSLRSVDLDALKYKRFFETAKK